MTEQLIPLECDFDTVVKLYAAYMPFIKGGGVFYRTVDILPIGSKIALSMHLPEEMDIFKTEGEVVWITPKGAQGNKPSGIGIQFKGDTSNFLVNKIETHLAGVLKSTQLTDTM